MPIKQNLHIVLRDFERIVYFRIEVYFQIVKLSCYDTNIVEVHSDIYFGIQKF